ENIRAGWRWACENHQLDAIEMSLESSWLYCYMRGQNQEGAEMFRLATQALAAPSAASDSTEDQRQIVLAHLRARWAWFVGAGEQTKQLLRESLAILRKIGAQRELGFSLIAISIAGSDWAELREDRLHVQESLAISQAVNDRWGTAFALLILGHLAIFNDDLGEARRFAQESLAVFREMDNRFGIHRALILFGELAIRRGEYAE